MVDVMNAAKLLIQTGMTQAEMSVGDGITNLRLNKLLFFAQAYSLAEYNEPLFSDEIQAWDMGPVVPKIYHNYKGFRNNVIEDTAPDRSVFSDRDYMTLLDVFSIVQPLSTFKLVNLSHTANAPWDTVYKKNKGGIIPQEAIREYYKKHPFYQRSFQDVLKELRGKAYVPARDENGVAIIPKDFSEGWDE